MVQSYKVTRLTSQTPQSDQQKLVTALKGVAGVEKVTLRPNSSEFEIDGKDECNPSDIWAAAAKAGFSRSDESGKQDHKSNQGGNQQGQQRSNQQGGNQDQRSNQPQSGKQDNRGNSGDQKKR